METGPRGTVCGFLEHKPGGCGLFTAFLVGAVADPTKQVVFKIAVGRATAPASDHTSQGLRSIG